MGLRAQGIAVITTQPESIARPLGANATFSVTATGLSLAYQWFRNGSAISGATASSFTIASVTVADGGTYQVRVSNPAGTVWSANAVLTTVAPPSITVQPASLVATQGFAMALSVTTAGDAPAYQWRRASGTLPLSLLNETFNSGNGGFTVTTPQSFAVPWTYNATSGTWYVGGPSGRNLQTNATRLASPTLTATQSGPVVLSFSHRYNFDPGYDAGAVRYSLNGAAFTLIPASAFVANGYNGTVASSARSELAGMPVFSAQSASGTNFIQSQANVGTLKAGDTLSLQFVASADASMGGAVTENLLLSLVLNNASSPLTDSATTPLGFTAFGSGLSYGQTAIPAGTYGSISRASAGSSSVRLTGTSGSGWRSSSSASANKLNSLTNNFTVMAWVRPSAVTDAGVMRVLSDDYGFASPSTWGFGLSAGSSSSQLLFTKFNVADFYSTSTILTADQWYHIAVTVSSSDGVVFYLNGQAAGSDASTAGKGNITPGTSPFIVGAEKSSGSGQFRGNISEIRVYNRVLTASEVILAGSGGTVPGTPSTGSAYTNRWEIDSTSLTLTYTNAVPISGATNRTYSIASVSTNDVGVYSVVATNLAGSVTSDWATLSVLVPPTITVQPVGQFLPVGGTLNLSGAAVGDQPMAYQWQCNNASLAGATNPVLTISSLTLANSGNYRLIASNVAGRATSSVAAVTVMTLPRFVSGPSSVFTHLGARVSLTASASGGGPPALQWYFREQPIAGATNATLVIESAELSHAGWYWVRATNRVGAIDSPRAWVVLSPLENRAVGWRDNSSGQIGFGAEWTNLVNLVAGDAHTMALRGDGTVLAVGANERGQSAVPAMSVRTVVVAAGANHGLALGENGRVTAWGDNAHGQTNVPPGLSNVVAVAAGATHSLALRADGSVVAWGGSDAAIRTVPSGVTGVRSIAAAGKYSVAVKSDGSAVLWGADLGDLGTVPSAATNLVAVSASPLHVVALRGDGSVVAWGNNDSGQLNVPVAASQVIGVAAGSLHSIAMLSSGAPIAWGAGTADGEDAWPDFGQSIVPAEVIGATAIAAGSYYSVAAVPTPPRFTSDLPARVGYSLGQTVTMEAKAAGALPLRYQWSRSGIPIDGATNATLVIANAGPAAAADYSVRVSNAGGAISTNFGLALDVAYESLAIATQPQSMSVTRTANAILVVEATGTSPIRYQWRRNGLAIDGATNSFYKAPTAQLTDTADYAVVVDNTWETLTSDVARVTVLDPPAWDESYTNATLSAGQSLTLKAGNTGSGPFDYQWYLNGQPIEGSNTNALVLPSLTWRDEGEYGVAISNPVGSITRTFYRLHVVSPPYFIEDLADVASPRNTSASLSAKVGGEPPLSFLWYQDGVLMPDEFRTNMVVQNVAYSHTNLSWRLVVTNSMGSITSRVARITIIEPPVILSQPSSVLAEPNTEARFTVVNGGTPPFAYRWLLNGAPVAGGTQPTLVIPSVTSTRQGLYEVEVSNPAGTVVSVPASLGANVAPVALGASALLTNVAPGTTLGLTARVAGIGPFTFQWLFNGAPIPGQTNLNLVISNTPPDAAGTYTFTVANAFGTATLADEAASVVRVVNLPFIESGPEDVLAILGRPATFGVTVRGTNRVSFQWTKDGEPIAGATEPSYTLASPATWDAGSYAVAVANSEGTTWSSPATLAFASLPKITRHPVPSVTPPGGTALYSVEVESILPVTYQWRRNGTDLADETNATLSVLVPARAVSWDHTYSVVVGSDVGRVSSTAAALTVARKPSVLLRHSRQVTQRIVLRPGWNAIHLNVQPAANSIEEVFASVPWTSVWAWDDRENSVQFIREMSEASWKEPGWLFRFQTNRVESFQNNLHRVFANHAYLVRIDGTEEALLEVVGEPGLAPIAWRPDSLNLTGLPLEPGWSPTVADYFRYSPAHFDSATGQVKPVYRLGPDGRWNLMSNDDPLEAGVAYWFHVRGGSWYTGPVEASLSYGRGLLFTRDVDSLSLTIRNRTPSPRRVWLTAHPSYADALPLMVREVSNDGVNQQELPSAYPVDIPGGGARTVTLGADRMRTAPGGYESVMVLSDDAGLALNIPVLVEHVADVTAPSDVVMPNVVGLWVGQATLEAISEVNSVTTRTNRIQFTNDLGKITNVTVVAYTNSPSEVPTPVASGLSQRIIFHNDGNQVVRLLSEVFQLRRPDVTRKDADGYNLVATQGVPVLVTRRDRLADFKGTRLRDGDMVGRRISSPTFAFGGDGATNNYVVCNGTFAPGGTVTVTFGLGADHPMNPFKHRYHPDHDNLGPDFRTYREEAYGILREVTLVFDADSGGTTPASGYNELKGEYRERIRGLHRNPIATSGRFVLRRLNTIAELNPAP